MMAAYAGDKLAAPPNLFWHIRVTVLTPLAVLLAAMQQKWDEGDIDAAASLARAAAPYVHARRATIREHGETELDRLSDAQLDELRRR